jgi:hypothetical protein
MSEQQLKNVLWMAEELDFQVQPEDKEEAKLLLNAFLESATNKDFSHSLYSA